MTGKKIFTRFTLEKCVCLALCPNVTVGEAIKSNSNISERDVSFCAPSKTINVQLKIKKCAHLYV